MSVQIIDNIEIGDIPETPHSLDSVPAMEIAEQSLLTKALEFGHPIAYAQEQDGRLMQHVFPIRGLEKDQISSSSGVDLELHTETCFHPYKPDYVFLLCLRGDSAAATTYATLESILGNIDPEVAFQLMQKQFTTTVDKSFRMNGEDDETVEMSILQTSEDGYIKLNYDSSVMSGTNSIATSALNELNKVISENIKEFTLEPGQLAIIDNNSTIHGRRPFTARYDGTDRWLMRCLVAKKLPPLQHRNGSVITITKFS